MANITSNKSLQVNITIAFDGLFDFNLLKTDEFEVKVKEIFGDSSKPVLSKFPNAFVLFDPINQVGVNIISNQRQININDTRVTDYTSRDLSNFIQFSKSVFDIIKKGNSSLKFVAWGVNIISLLDLDSDDSSEFLLNKFIKKEVFDGEDVSGGAIRFYVKKEGYRNDIKIEPRFHIIDVTPTKQIQVIQNSQFSEDSLPELSSFSEKVKKIYNELPAQLGKLLS